MSTRSRIGIVQDDDTVLSVYCHSDGYLEGPHGVGWNLFTHFKDRAKTLAMIKLGDRRMLEPTWGSTWGSTYGRVYGGLEADGPKAHESEAGFYANGEEYDYLLDRNGTWWVQTYADDLPWPQKRTSELALALVTKRITT